MGIKPGANVSKRDSSETESTPCVRMSAGRTFSVAKSHATQRLNSASRRTRYIRCTYVYQQSERVLFVIRIQFDATQLRPPNE